MRASLPALVFSTLAALAAWSAWPWWRDAVEPLARPVLGGWSPLLALLAYGILLRPLHLLVVSMASASGSARSAGPRKLHPEPAPGKTR